MAAELVETSRLFARTVAAIDPAWAEALAGDLVKRSYGEPRWEKKQGSAVADEKVTLYGVPIVPKRRVQLARIDPEQARELFIRHALVDGDWPYAIDRNPLYAFDRENRALREELTEVEERTRRRDILVDDEAVVDFYDRRLPGDRHRRARVREVVEGRVGDAARPAHHDPRRAARRGRRAARPTRMPTRPSGSQGDQRFRLAYRFEPGAEDDGVTVELPLALLARVEPDGFSWLVPALQRGARHRAAQVAAEGDPQERRARGRLGAQAAARWSRSAPRSDASRNRPRRRDPARRPTPPPPPTTSTSTAFPPHLRMTFAAVDERGKRLGTSKDLAELQARFAERTRTSVAKATTASAPDRSLERAGITTWDVGDIPRGGREHGRHGHGARLPGPGRRGRVRRAPRLRDRRRAGVGAPARRAPAARAHGAEPARRT